MGRQNRSARRDARAKPDSVIHTRIEHDRRHFWHPVVEIRERGAVVYCITSMTGYGRPDRAVVEALRESQRIMER